MKIGLILVFFMLGGCFDNTDKTDSSNIKLGEQVFNANCTVCHGKAGAGIVKDWKVAIDGKYPPPPLNGTAHTWHHSRAILLRSINDGGAKFGGQMPAFKDKLTEPQKQAVLDYIYNLWPPEIQQKYNARFK